MQGHSIINLGSLDWHDKDGVQHKGLIIHADTGSIEVNSEEFGDMKNRVASGMEVEGAKTVSGNTLPGGNPLSYELNPAGTSVMKDIRIENLGGAALSDVMPKLSLMAVHRDVGINGFVPAPGFKVNAASTGLERDTGAKTCPVGYAPALNVVPKTMASGVNQSGTVATAKNENCELQGTGSDSCMIVRGPACTCPSGYTQSGTTCTGTTTYAATPNYSCPSGGSVTGSQCYQTQSASTGSCTGYSCPSGVSPVNGNCTYTTTYAPSQVLHHCFCLDGYVHMGDKVCRKTGMNLTLCAADGGSLNGSACITTGFNCSYTSECVNGGYLSGSMCTVSYSAPASCSGYNYTCSSGYTLSGTTCYRYYAASVSSYSCPSGGTLSGSTCTRVDTASASCPITLTLNSCPFTTYNAPPSPWIKTLENSATVTGGTSTTYVYQNGSGSADVPPDFKGAKHTAAPQSLTVGGVTYTSGWKITELEGYDKLDANVYCRYVSESLH
jgi:hypothetical protein